MKVLLFGIVLIGTAMCSPRLDPLVETSEGLIRGLQATDGDYSMFLGIPYATVNESNPFGASHPFPKFDEVFEAYDDSAKCPHKDKLSTEIVGSIDCLRLNIYAPNKATTRNRLPVMVFIYGGVFQVGHSARTTYGPKYLVRNDVILVTFNYRVGVYGFMCLDTAEVPGNQGLKDQLIALRWIKQNIEAFGGDANKITLFGQSAGGVSVDFHMMYTEEKLFDRAILQSGTTQCPWVMEDRDREAPFKLAQRLGYSSNDINDALSFLATVQPKIVVAAVSDLAMSFLPCVEREFDGVKRFITEHPHNRAGQISKSVPILAGYTSDEMLYYTKNPAKNYPVIFRENLELIYDLNGDDDGEMERLLREYYIGDESPSVEMLSELTDFESDFTFNHPVHSSVQKFLQNGHKVYHYVFSYSGARNYGKVRNNMTDEGVAHSDDNGYLFDISFILTEEPTEEDQLTIDRMTAMWTNFAKYGDPTPEINELLPVKWAPVTRDAMNYLDINSDLTLKKRPFHDRMAFWDLFYTMNKGKLKVFKRGNV